MYPVLLCFRVYHRVSFMNLHLQCLRISRHRDYRPLSRTGRIIIDCQIGKDHIFTMVKIECLVLKITNDGRTIPFYLHIFSIIKSIRPFPIFQIKYVRAFGYIYNTIIPFLSIQDSPQITHCFLSTKTTKYS